MVTVVAVKSIFVPVAGSNKLHNKFFVQAIVTFSLRVDEAVCVKLPVFTVVVNALSIDHKTEGGITSTVHKLIPS